jgi:phospholipid/cholesterol/gamma-HCH transport system substrate-binding protein
MTESVSGLNVDAPLKFRGVDVGKVTEISIDTSNSERIRLVLQVRQGTPITEDTVATLEYQGLTGIANINLIGGSVGSPPIQATPGEEYPVIVSKPSLFARLDSTMSGLLENLTETSANINALLSPENRDNMSSTIDNIAVLTGALASQSRDLESAISNLGKTLENAEAASVELPNLINQFSQSAEAITRMADQIRDVGENLGSASEGIERAVEASGDGLVYFSNTTLPDITATIAELRLASENLRRASELVAEDPSVLLYGQAESKKGPGE